MIKKMTIDFPDINEAFINATDIIDVCNNYIDILYRSGDFYNSQYGNKLLEFVESNNKISILEEEFHEFKCFLRDWSKSNSVKLTLSSRKKSFIGFNSKIRLFLSKGMDLGMDLNAIRDLLGFKIVISSSPKDSTYTQELAYNLMNDILFFFSSKRKGLLLNAEKRLGVPLDTDSTISKKIFVCENNLLKPEFNNKVKNYILFPKDTGYQGLHAYVQTPSGLIFEIQVKTLAMELYDESIHQSHKKSRYENFNIPLDYDKIHLPGVVFNKNNYLICDKCGLLNSIDPFYMI